MVLWNTSTLMSYHLIFFVFFAQCTRLFFTFKSNSKVSNEIRITLYAISSYTFYSTFTHCSKINQWKARYVMKCIFSFKHYVNSDSFITQQIFVLKLWKLHRQWVHRPHSSFQQKLMSEKQLFLQFLRVLQFSCWDEDFPHISLKPKIV